MPMTETRERPRRHALHIGRLNLGWPYAIIVFFLGLNWLWDIFDRLIK